MPELPEVETTRRGIEPWVVGRILSRVEIRNSALRWPVQCPTELVGAEVLGLRRRGKYLLFYFQSGVMIVHLGMSGSLRVLQPTIPEPLPHDHVEWQFDDHVLRLNDPRRFGCVLYQPGDDAEQHPLLAHLGVEPLGNEFNGALLFKKSRRRKLAIKNFIMDSRIVVGVGNIYAAEALFMAGIRPGIAAGTVSANGYDELAAAIRAVLARAVEVGGTTLRDFVGADGQPGYFKQSLYVYGRDGQPCRVCGAELRLKQIGQRSSVYCPKCQTANRFVPLARRSG